MEQLENITCEHCKARKQSIFNELGLGETNVLSAVKTCTSFKRGE